jgi:polyribonucleotide nucleotidyltransferase
VFYVGKSSNGTKAMLRHTQSWSLNENPESDKNKKIVDIMIAGHKAPIYMILATARNKKELAMKERVLIAQHAEKTYLTNVQVNR